MFLSIIIPGGESTVIGRLAEKLNIILKLINFVNKDSPILGTCAGMVMLAKEVYHGGEKVEKAQETLRILKEYVYGSD